MARVLLTFFFATLFCFTSATPSHKLLGRASVKTLSSSTIHSYKPYAFYSSAAYCSPSNIKKWNCGANCKANPHFLPNITGGDGSTTRYWYVGYDPTLNTVIVSHEGASPGAMLSSLDAADSALTPLDQAYFGGISTDIKVHKNLANEHLRSAYDLFYAVANLLVQYIDERPSVTLVGHSRGAALSLLDAVMFTNSFPPLTKIKYVGYGLPRVGNQAFADYVDKYITSIDEGAGFVRINNKKDPVPINPSRALGFVHPSGEIHIQASGAWVSCPGQDNSASQCIRGTVQNDASGTKQDSYGPYDGVTMGC
ncbi:alpha/beta-hydrolase [Schizopora paradoxa]|uniref:Alpha/beta-hydrolase n=1 Tax=Schizopora paradoxa TaxID=27342 RepID=A0A0H2RCJ8_9AGAM|nr:alpha/beta-hydrolase [Schizopora paradoxa]